MAFITECRLCGGSAPNHDHDKCAEDYGKRIERKILDWFLSHPDQPLPQVLREELKGAKWKAYEDYLARVKKRTEIDQKAARYGKQIEAKLQKAGDAAIEKLDSDFQVKVSVECVLVPRF